MNINILRVLTSLHAKQAALTRPPRSLRSGLGNHHVSVCDKKGEILLFDHRHQCCRNSREIRVIHESSSSVHHLPGSTYYSSTGLKFFRFFFEGGIVVFCTVFLAAARQDFFSLSLTTPWLDLSAVFDRGTTFQGVQCAVPPPCRKKKRPRLKV
jgi:hypothetical protein